MSVITKLRVKPETTISEDIRVEIPKKGKIPPSETRTNYSGRIKAQQIIIPATTNYIPGKISFEKTEES